MIQNDRESNNFKSLGVLLRKLNEKTQYLVGLIIYTWDGKLSETQLWKSTESWTVCDWFSSDMNFFFSALL